MPSLLSGTENGVLTLTLNRPERANAFNAELIVELQDAFAKAAKDLNVRCIVLTGAGRAFSAGQDISEMQGGGKISYREHLEKTYNPLILQIRNIQKPVIAALNGPCAGAAFGVALACDLRFACETTSLVVGFGGIALVPDSAVSLFLPALIGLSRAQYFFMTNEAILPEQALEWGLVNKLFSSDKFTQETMAFAAQLAAGPVGAYGMAKQVFNKAALPNLENALKAEADAQEIAGKSAEHKEGVSAFMGKRKPKYI